MCYNERMQNIKLILQFDGSAYHGWQKQKNAVTIQEIIERALFDITGEEVTVTGCGRTDSGVHAKGYVCNFKTGASIPPERFAYALDARLPEDIVCIASGAVDMNFDAKRSAKAKKYTYLILNSEFPDVFLRNRSWHYKYPLDIIKMQNAAKYFVGEHDFVGFASSGYTVKTTVRTIYSLEVSQKGDLIQIDVCGNGFLYNMVRIITGTLLFCGAGRIEADSIPEIIISRDRSRAGITAPPGGLYLSEVFYK